MHRRPHPRAPANHPIRPFRLASRGGIVADLDELYGADTHPMLAVML
jgi:hypothetical protein